ncbi:hypothetical protein [Evansella cellulosilytica]|nr:hypothetical protein [Evansella cellulosilytica]
MPAKKTVNLEDFIKLPKIEVDIDLKEKLHSILDDKKKIKHLKRVMSKQKDGIRLLKELSEIIALRLNLPTKDDVANIAKISIQIEEKIDSLEEKFAILADRLQDTPELQNLTQEIDEITEDAKQTSNTRKNESDERKQSLLIDPLKQLQRDFIFKTINHQDKDQELSDLTTLLIRKLNKIE